LFWSYYFLYQRGEDKQRRDTMFKEFIRPLIPQAVWDDAWTERWHFLHNSTLHQMAGRVHRLMKKWLATSAGEVFTTEIRTLT
jgi:glutathione S-transferase